jgi:hypothetical protein
LRQLFIDAYLPSFLKRLYALMYEPLDLNLTF